MSSILLVTQNELLAAIYSLNIRDLFGLSVKICSNYTDAISLLHEKHNFKFILTGAIENEEQLAVILYQHLVDSEIDTKIVVFGEDKDLPEELLHVEDIYNIEKVLSSIASITNEEFSPPLEEADNKYFAINLSIFLGMEVCPTDAFFYSTEDGKDIYIKVIKENLSVWPKIEKFRNEGIEALYVTDKDRKKFIDFVTNKFLKDIKEEDNSETEMTPERVVKDVAQIEKGVKIIAQKIFETEKITSEVVEISGHCLKKMEGIISKVPNITKLCDLLTTNPTGYLFTHSIMANGVGRRILTRLSWCTPLHIEILNHVFFFGDIFLAPIYDKYPHLQSEEEALFDECLNNKEKEILLSHSQKASELIKNFPDLVEGTDIVIRQHHGMVEGEGFATKFRDDISPIAKIVNIAEAYTEELLKRKNKGTTKDERALIIEDLLQKFDKESYHVFIEILGDLEI